MAFRSDLDALILAILADGPLHGYGIVKRVHKHSGGHLRLGEGQLYPALHRLEEAGLVAPEWDSEEGKTSRKTYALTATGRSELKKQRSNWMQFSKSINAIFKLSHEN